jgi:hypothetical protein
LFSPIFLAVQQYEFTHERGAHPREEEEEVLSILTLPKRASATSLWGRWRVIAGTRRKGREEKWRVHKQV